ncbi:unnamed protein product [Phaedon cochleariae]|uniref:Large ribosomal subunit protein mL64 n=1 Tax=Phaedon cochleariae TaxID=80249 RepID=A0A9P0DU40_PHACE|nr:unnamed protein product [Phaedon cochleariae]
MMRHEIIKNIISVHRGITGIRQTSSHVNIENLEKESVLTDNDFIVDDEHRCKEEQIEKSRNKSRLRSHDRNIVMEKNPYLEPMLWHHGTIKYLRRTYGRYGQSSGVNPSICWPTKEELENVMEYEMVKYPYTIPQMIAEAKQKRKENDEKVMARQQGIVEKLKKLEGWKQDLYNRISKKESEAKAAKERKERLVEEVRRHFGFKVDPKDDKFKEMLEKKEKQQKKAMKEERQKIKEAKMVEKLYSKKI